MKKRNFSTKLNGEIHGKNILLKFSDFLENGIA